MSPLVLFAQPKWEIGFMAGGAGYQGELTPEWYPEWEEINGMYGLFLRRNISSNWALRFNASYSQLSGSDRNFTKAGFKRRNFAFEGQAGQASLLVEWEPFGKRRYPDTLFFKGLFSPYFFSGIGIAHLDTRADFSQTGLDQLFPLIEIDRLQANPQNRLALTPLGIGIKLDLGPGVVLGFEAAATTAFTDYFDGISQAGKSGTNDWHSYAGLSLSFRLIPKDTDRDGIADKEDACPQVEGHISAQGCPDMDGDGVEDLEDICPTEHGLAALNGCPDTDDDGVADREDRCPLAPGLPDTNGCPDHDKDGIANLDDQCIRLPGPASGQGCPQLDADADGELVDEPEICVPTSYANSLKQINLFTQPIFAVIDFYTLELQEKAEPPETGNTLKQETKSYFD